MKVYVAGPMRGIPEFNFPAFFGAAIMLERLGHEVFNPARRDNEQHGRDISVGNPTGSLTVAAEDHGFSLRVALAADVKWICEEGEAIFMLNGWASSAGALAEYHLAMALGQRVWFETDRVFQSS